MVDNNLWLIQDEFVRNPNSMQAAVITYYRNMIHEFKDDNTQKLDVASADSIIADVVERNSHSPTRQ